MWARLVDSKNIELRIWLTRRLCSKACETIIKLLEETTHPTAIAKNQISLSTEAILMEEHETSLKKTANSVPDEKKQNVNGSTSPIEMCYSIEINCGDSWQIKFFGQNPSRGFKINTDRQNIHRILSALLVQSKQAGWAIDFNAN